ncbi:MAG: hypothetical protein K2X87_20280 [Gemmataceae bacterium]|nr:hypothetical protein [Gemmataceae bacterium]
MVRVVLLPLVVAGLAGCAGGGARYVSKQGDGGVVAIPADTDAWPTHYRKKAEELIVRHVGPDFEVVGEGEVVTGQSTNHDQKVQRDKTFNTTNPFLPAEKDTINTTTTTRDITEYHITYRRRGSAGVPAAGPVTPAGGSIPSVGPR